MRQSTQSDGWDVDQLIIQQLQQKRLIRFRGEKALNLLQMNQYSLQPDMVSGWRPKLPSCPLPLTYQNYYIDQVKLYLLKQQRKNVIYIGPRPSNSVQVNQKYNYFWKYRSRYSINVNILKEAIINVGSYKQQNPIIVENQHIFDSAFEGGNLDLAIKVKNNQYDCFIRSDTNTRGHTNWFYFKITNKKQIGPIKINICNFMKSKSMYTDGMRPYCRTSEVEEWSQQPCYQIIFGEKQCRFGMNIKTYWLQFSYNFRKQYSQVYFAYSIPYTYSDLQNFINELKQKNYKQLKIATLCESLGGISLPLFIINSQFLQQFSFVAPKNYKTKKKVIIITGRIHPGQSNSSYLIEGFVRNVLNNHQLLTNHIFYIVPMLNPDGVIVGNFRTSYSGKDLNRQFNKLNKYLFPQIYGLKQLTQKIKSTTQYSIQFYFDFHGHSLKKNLFCYGPQHKPKSSYNMQAKAFAKIIERQNKIFDYKSSIFAISQSKRNTARAYMLEKLNIPMSFTFQISNGLYQNQSKTFYINKEIIIKAGQAISSSLMLYFQLQNKIPRKNITAKIDSGKYDRKIYYLKRSLKTIKSNRVVIEQSFNQNLYFKQQKSNKFLNNTFAQIINQIKKQNPQIIEDRQRSNGSDSEGSQQDLNKQQSQALFQVLINKKTVQDYRNTYKRDNKQNQVNILKCQKILKQNYISQKDLKLSKKIKSVNFRRKQPNLSKNKKQIQQINKYAIPSKHYTFFV